MNIEQLEQKIRSLPLRTPSSDLDESLAELFHSENPPVALAPGQSGNRFAAGGDPDQSRLTGTHRFLWIAASLLGGLVAGFAIGSQRSDDPNGPGNQGLNGAAMGAESPGERLNSGEIVSNGASDGVRQAPQTAIFPETGSAEGIPTSIFLEAEKRGIARTAAARTAFWQEKTGESFDVRSHLADSRFDFCRLCHLADGS